MYTGMFYAVYARVCVLVCVCVCVCVRHEKIEGFTSLVVVDFSHSHK